MAVEEDLLDEQITITELHKSRRSDSNIVLAYKYIVPEENWQEQESQARDLFKLNEANLRVQKCR